MKRLIALSLCAFALSASAINITNYPVVTTVDQADLILLSKIAAATNNNIAYTNFVRQLTNDMAANNLRLRTVTVTNLLTLSQLSSIPTSTIPASTASATNWAICQTNGTLIAVATNYNNDPAGDAFYVKVLAP